MQIEIRKPLDGQSGQLVICTCETPEMAAEVVRILLSYDKQPTAEIIVRLVSRYED